MLENIAEELVKYDIISSEESEKLKSQFKENQGSPLNALFRLFYEKTTGNLFPTQGMHSFSLGATQIKIDEVNVGQLRNLLDILFGGHLFEDVTYKKLQAEISNYQIVNGFHLVYRASNLNHFYKNFTKEHQLAFFKQLKGEDFKSNLLDNRKETKLSKAIEKGELVSYRDFFKYCYNCKFFDFKPKKYNRDDLFNRVLKIYHELSYPNGIAIDKCHYEIIENDEIKTPAYKLINLSFQIADKILTHSYELRDNLASKKYNYGYDIGNFLELLNSALADFGYDYRLTMIDDQSKSKGALQEDSLFVICRIDKQMLLFFDLTKLHEKFLSIRPRFDFWPRLSYYQIQYALHHYKISGVLNHLNNEQIENVSVKTFGYTYGSYVEFVNWFPGTVVAINRWKRIEKEPYRFFLESLSKVSQNVLNFYDIEDGYPGFPIEKETEFIVNFKIDGKSYSLTLLSYGEFNTQIVYQVNEIIKNDYPDYLLLDVIGSGVGNIYYMFLKAEQAQYLSKVKILWTRPIF